MNSWIPFLFSLLLSFVLMSNCPRFGQWEAFQTVSWVFLTYSYHFFEKYFPAQVFQVCLFFFFPPQLWNQPFLQRSFGFFSGEWCLETKIWACWVVIASRCLQQKDLENICTKHHKFYQ